MVEIEISSDQRAYLEELQSDLAERYVGEYGHVRPMDALQYLIDHHDGDTPTEAASEEGANEPADTETAGDDTDHPAGDEGGHDDADRLEAMMNLLDRHDDKWREADSEDGKYAVTLPDGESETVRTKDDVRGLLFKHYN